MHKNHKNTSYHIHTIFLATDIYRYCCVLISVYSISKRTPTCIEFKVIQKLVQVTHSSFKIAVHSREGMIHLTYSCNNKWGNLDKTISNNQNKDTVCRIFHKYMYMKHPDIHYETQQATIFMHLSFTCWNNTTLFIYFHNIMDCLKSILHYEFYIVTSTQVCKIQTMQYSLEYNST